MNTKTAGHLNKLRSLAQPVVLRDGILIDGPITAELKAAIAAIEQGATAEAVRREIVAAATERRDADTNMPDWAADGWCWAGSQSGRSAVSIPWKATAARWGLIVDVVRAVLVAHNEATAATYEAYRVACAQGVAVAPQA